MRWRIPGRSARPKRSPRRSMLGVHAIGGDCIAGMGWDIRANTSGRPRLDQSHGTPTIPINTALMAVQSNEVYLPRMRQRSRLM